MIAQAFTSPVSVVQFREISMKRKQKNQRGFTLIELIVVTAIIALLAAIIFIAVNSARGKARDATRKVDVSQLNTAINFYYQDNSSLPGNSTGYCSFITNPSGGYAATFRSALVPSYVTQVPTDPLYSGKVGDYLFRSDDNTGGKFTLCTSLEQDTGTNYDYGPTGAACPGVTSDTAYNYCINQ